MGKKKQKKPFKTISPINKPFNTISLKKYLIFINNENITQHNIVIIIIVLT